MSSKTLTTRWMIPQRIIGPPDAVSTPW